MMRKENPTTNEEITVCYECGRGLFQFWSKVFLSIFQMKWKKFHCSKSWVGALRFRLIFQIKRLDEF